MAFEIERAGRNKRVPRRSPSVRLRFVLAVTLSLAVLTVTTTPAYAADESDSSIRQTGRMVFDLAVLRPLQVVQVAVSALVFVPAYPVAWPFGGGDDVLELCITEPVDRAFRRPLGEL